MNESITYDIKAQAELLFLKSPEDLTTDNQEEEHHSLDYWRI